MKPIISISIALLFFQSVKAQENSSKKYFLFENPVTKEQIRIETGNKVAIRFKIPNVRLTGTILSISDSSLILGAGQDLYRQPLRNIATITLITEAKKIYVARVKLKSGIWLKGAFIHNLQDSLTLLNMQNFQRIRIAAMDIQSIRISRTGAIGRGIGQGAGTGAILGAILMRASSSDCSTFCLETESAIAGGVIGGLIGSLAGAAIGSLSKEFKIEGNQAQFDMFVNEFKK